MSGEPRTAAWLDALPRLRLTGAQLNDIDPDPEQRFYVDWDEYDEFVRLDAVREAIAQERERLAALVPADPWYSPDLGTGSSQPDDECYYCLTPKPDHAPDCWWVALREALQGADR